MTDDVRTLALGVTAAVFCLALGWFARGALWGRRLRRKQAFFGLPAHSETLLVVDRDGGGPDGTVARHDVFALLELSAIIKGCAAHAQLVPHDTAQQSVGERTEFCVGHPTVNRRMGAHLASLLPGVSVNVDPEPGPDRGAFRIGSEQYRMEPGQSEHVLLARLTTAEGARPVFLFCGQRAVTSQAAARHLARHHRKLARKYGDGPFVLLLRVVNSQAYGSDVVELVADVTRAAHDPAPERLPAPKTSHRATS